MNAAVKKQWVEALRSGEYAQGQNHLRQVVRGRDQFCCLGVLCDLYTQEFPEVATKWADQGTGTRVISLRHLGTNYRGELEYLYSHEVLTPAVREWAGLKSDDPVVEYGEDKKPSTLSALNDCVGLELGEIADIIERSL